MSQLDPKSLKSYEGQVLELHFADGFAAVVKLVHVSEDDDEDDIVYDLLDVLDWGPLDPAKVDRNAAHAATSRDLLMIYVRPAYRRSDHPPN